MYGNDILIFCWSGRRVTPENSHFLIGLFCLCVRFCFSCLVKCDDSCVYIFSLVQSVFFCNIADACSDFIVDVMFVWYITVVDVMFVWYITVVDVMFVWYITVVDVTFVWYKPKWWNGLWWEPHVFDMYLIFKCFHFSRHCISHRTEHSTWHRWQKNLSSESPWLY